jgi:hypothetical protein
MQQYKFQALLKLTGTDEKGAPAITVGQTQRALIRVERQDSHENAFFTALVTSHGDGSDWLAASELMVTIVVRGDDPRAYLDVGEEFSLWRGRDIARGVVTRRVFV